MCPQPRAVDTPAKAPRPRGSLVPGSVLASASEPNEWAEPEPEARQPNALGLGHEPEEQFDVAPLDPVDEADFADDGGDDDFGPDDVAPGELDETRNSAAARMVDDREPVAGPDDPLPDVLDATPPDVSPTEVMPHDVTPREIPMRETSLEGPRMDDSGTSDTNPDERGFLDDVTNVPRPPADS